jgi:hypothetical protein
MSHKEEKEKKRPQFVHRLSREKIIEFMGFSVEEKLNWLEEANEFVTTCVDSEKLNLWKKVKGER